MNSIIADLRQDYRLQSLDIGDVLPNPIQQFEKWFADVLKAEILEPNAMVLATATKSGKPSARVVLLKDLSPEGFTFFTNYKSRKGGELEKNNYAALCFNWLELQRQVRIEGKIEKVSEQIATTYFNTRPYASRIGALSSPQSEIVPDRKFLEDAEKHTREMYPENTTVPKPENWGGYILKPTMIEFWQGRRSRLHDRIVYRLKNNNTWVLERLAP